MVNFRVFRSHPQDIFLILIMTAFSNMLLLLEFFFLRWAFNILEESPLATFTQFTLFISISYLSRILSLVFSWLFAVLLYGWILKSKVFFGSEILAILTKSKLKYYNTVNKEGKILSMIDNDLSNYISNKIYLISFYISNVTFFISAAIFLIYNNWIFGLIVVVCFIVLQLTPKNFKRRLEKIDTNQSRANKDFIANFSEALDNHLPLRVMHSAKLLKREMFVSSKNEIDATYRKDRFTTLVSDISALVFFSAQRIFIFSAIFIYSLGYFGGHLRLGDVLSLPSVLGTLSHSLSYLVNAKLQKESANNYLKIMKDRIAEILKNTTDNLGKRNLEKTESIKNFSSLPCSITIENLGFSYEKHKVFNDLNLKFKQGVVYGMQGVSGIGKSTLISLILGKHNNYKGSIKIGEKEVKNLGEEKIFDLVKLVDSSNFVFDATIEENVTLFDKSLDPLPALKNAALLEEFESLSQQKVEATNLSEGQKQRVNLARLFQHIGDAKILILDEALSNLDKISREKVKESFGKLKNQGYTLIFISHHIDKNDSFYDKLINLEDEVKKAKTFSGA